MIVRITFENMSLHSTMMFGDSYKSWDDQLEEFIRFTGRRWKPYKVEVSKEKWIGWGGLKWCTEASFQDELNREGCQDKEPANPNPRQYSEMKFEIASPKIMARIKKIVKG
jgi:hypothetical protein